MRPRGFTELTAIVAILGTAAPAAGADLAIGRVRTRAGQEASVNVTYAAGPAALVALSTDVTFDGSVLGRPRCEAGKALAAGVKSVRCAEPRPGLLRLAILGLNAEAVPAGEVARIAFDVVNSAKPGRYRLRHRAGGADADGRESRLTSRPGLVEIVRP